MGFEAKQGLQVEANELVLFALNHFFMKTLKRNKHPHHRLIYMRGDIIDRLTTVADRQMLILG